VPTSRPLSGASRGSAGASRRYRGRGQHAGSGPPPQPPGDRPARRRRGGERPPFADVEWPFWLLMVFPWVAWGLLLVVPRIDICWTCLAEMMR
jgi:hypothetical protein